MKRKIFLSLATAAIVVAPIASVVACGSETKKLGGATGGLETPKILNTDGDKYISDVQNLSTPYSVESLRNEAINLKDDAGWWGGLTTHSIESVFSLVHALADAYGYSTEKDADGKTAFDKFLEESEGAPTLLTNQNIDSYKNDKQANVKFLANLSQDSSKVAYPAAYRTGLVYGFDGFELSSVPAFGLTADKPLVWDPAGGSHQTLTYDGKTYWWDGSYKESVSQDVVHDEVNDHLDFNNPFMWDDVSEPGKVDVLYRTKGNENVARIVKLDNIKSKYPTIEKNLFIKEYVPFAKAVIVKLLKFLSTNQMYMGMTAMSGGDSTFLMSQIAFIQSKNTVKDADGNDVMKFNDEDLTNKLTALNNGSIHWLAIKSAWLGFDSSFSTKAPIFSLIGNQNTETNTMNGAWSIGMDFSGIDKLSTEELDIDAVMPVLTGSATSEQWLKAQIFRWFKLPSWSIGDSQTPDKESYTWDERLTGAMFVYHADKTIDQNYALNSIDSNRQEQIKQAVDAVVAELAKNKP